MTSLSTSTTQPDPIRPFDAVMLRAGDGHWLYVEQVGTPGALPVLFLHGGPGSGSQHAHRALFDPNLHHAILFDQRGAGRSHPYLSRRNNTTQRLIDDIETIRTFFAFEKFLITGGSWGSTLALAYTQAFPTRVSGIVIRAVFLGTDAEVRWAFLDGPKKLRPKLYDQFINFLPPDERAEPLAAYIARLTSDDPAIYAPAAHVWNAYERNLSEVNPHINELPANPDLSSRLPPTPLIEAHYIKHSFFLEPDQLLANMPKLAGIPGHIIQGRQDILCPPENATAVAHAWHGCRLNILDHAGHAMTEPGIFPAMKTAIAELL